MPTKKKPKKAKVKKSKSKNLVLYVEDCLLKGKVFSNVNLLNAWVKDFNKSITSDDDWIDIVVTDIKGDITAFEPSLEIT